MLGITIGVAALIVVLGVFNGFSSLVTSYLVSFDPHIRIEAISDRANDELINAEKLIKSQRISNYTGFVNGKVIAIQNKITQVVELKGIDEIKGKDVYGFDDAVFYGSSDLRTEGNIPNIIIGIQLADKMQALVGDTLTVISPTGIERAILSLSLPNSQKFLVSGIFHSSNNEYDAQLMFTSLEAASKLLGYGKNIQGYELRLENLDESVKYKKVFESQLDKDFFSINTWYDFHKDLYNVMQIERWVAYLILSLIIAVAVFNTLGSLTMSVIEKRRDIGVLRTAGMTEKSISKVFLLQGFYVGLIGTLAGFVLGYLVYYLQITYNIYPLDPAQYRIDSLPIELRISDFFAVGTASFLLSLLASIYPAKKAAKINPVEAIKWE
jgi:lipoprotein-releasing system permease protein